jgi:quinol monooxygenase YgiN
MTSEGLIVYVDRSAIRPGRRAELEEALGALASLVQAEEPAILAYQAHLSDDGSTLSVLHIHRDIASLERHFAVAGPLFPKFVDLVDMRSIDVYGPVPERIVTELRSKALLLGSATVGVHPKWLGFDRLASRETIGPTPDA